MAKYVLTNKAVADLTGIWEYTVEVWSEAQADKYYTTITDACQFLADNPATGKPYHTIADNLLGYRVERHIIFYSIASAKSIRVIRILHERMDLRNRILGD